MSRESKTGHNSPPLPPENRGEIPSSKEIMAANLMGGLVDILFHLNLVNLNFSNIQHKKDEITRYLRGGVNSESTSETQNKQEEELATRIMNSGLPELVFEYCVYLATNLQNQVLLASGMTNIPGWIAENNKNFFSQLDSFLGLIRDKDGQEKTEATVMVLRLFFLLDQLNTLSKEEEIDRTTKGLERRLVTFVALDVSLYDDNSFAAPLFAQIDEYYGNDRYKMEVSALKTLGIAQKFYKKCAHGKLQVFNKMLIFFKSYVGGATPFRVICEEMVVGFPDLSLSQTQVYVCGLAPITPTTLN